MSSKTYCVEFYRNGRAVDLHVLDARICRLMEVRPHPLHWCCDWYNVLAYTIAVNGHLDFEDLDGDLKVIAEYLQTYDIKTWVEDA